MTQSTQFANVRRGENGYRLGQDHQRARLTDDQVRAMRALYADRRARGIAMGYESLAAIFKCGTSTARDIILCKTRAL